MSKVFLMPLPTGTQIPDYAGRLLCLNPEKATRFQCGGFILGAKRRAGVVTEEAQMYNIHQAILDGRLLDITEEGDIRTENSTLADMGEEATGKKVYFTNVDGAFVCVGVEDPELQQQLDEQIKNTGRLELPPGYLDQEKYLLHVPEEKA